MSDIVHQVGLSASGLLVEIATFQDGERTGFVQVHRRAWPSVVAAVAACMTERRVLAEAETIATNAADERAED